MGASSYKSGGAFVVCTDELGGGMEKEWRWIIFAFLDEKLPEDIRKSLELKVKEKEHIFLESVISAQQKGCISNEVDEYILQEQLKMNSKNSSKPPSSDVLKKPPVNKKLSLCKEKEGYII